MSSSQNKEALLHILGIQSPIIWEDPKANRLAFSESIQKCLKEDTKENVDLIVLPEVFTTGFSMNIDSIDSWKSGETLDWMRDLAKNYNVAITGSVAFRFEDGMARNRSLFVKPDGSFEFYDKRHLFTFGKENEHYEGGEARKVVEFRGWRILLQICYDLRFPCFARNSISDTYDVALYVANWPEVRRHPWRTLLQARAIENQSYVIAVNWVGKDGNDIKYERDSCVIDPWGNYLVKMDAEERVSSVDLDLVALREYRESFPVHLDADILDIKA